MTPLKGVISGKVLFKAKQFIANSCLKVQKKSEYTVSLTVGRVYLIYGAPG